MLIYYAKEILQIVYIVMYAHTMYICNVCLSVCVCVCVHACIIRAQTVNINC